MTDSQVIVHERERSENRRELLTADQITWTPAPAPWVKSHTLQTLTVELLPTIDQPEILDLVERLATTLIDRDEQLRAAREVQSVTLTGLHETTVDRDRLRERRRDAATQTQRQGQTEASYKRTKPKRT